MKGLKFLFRKILVFFLCIATKTLAAPAIENCDTTVWFVNIYPGSEIYELEGHSALRIKTCDFDMAINYGMFSFETPNFVYRFVKGETDYMVGAIPWDYFIHEYQKSDRRIVSNRLNLSPEQKEKLIDLVNENLRPENRVYRYNYILDNCATRPLRTVELAIGDTILLSSPTSWPEKDSFREYMRYFHRNYPWYQFGIDLALGHRIDKPVTVRECSFAPVLLDDQLRNARVGGPNGLELVSETTVLNDVDPENVVLKPTPWYLTPIFVAWLISLLVAFSILYRFINKRPLPRIVISVLYGVYGLAGLLIAFLVFISVHEATSPNVNILWLNPLCFIPAVGIWIKKAKKVNTWYFLLNFVLLLALIVLWFTGYQSPNSAFIPLVLLDLLISGLYPYRIFFSENKKYQKE